MYGRLAVFDRLGVVFDRLGAVFDRFAAVFDRFCAVSIVSAAFSIENAAETKYLNSTRIARPPKGPGSSSRIQMLKSRMRFRHCLLVVTLLEVVAYCQYY